MEGIEACLRALSRRAPSLAMIIIVSDCEELLQGRLKSAKNCLLAAIVTAGSSDSPLVLPALARMPSPL
jgi:hypothetical protein